MTVGKFSKLPQHAVFKKILKRCSSLGRKNDAYADEHYGLPSTSQKSISPSTLARSGSASNPEFQSLLRAVEEVFGFDHNMGLTIPCEDAVFLSLIFVLY